MSLRRRIVFIAAGSAIALLLMRFGYDFWLSMIAGAGLFLGITDFGRRCPLLLSARHHYASVRKKISG
jgi:hypothetical protein